MSDVGFYASLEAEIYTALTTPALTDVARVAMSMGLQDMLAKDGIQLPCVGIIDAGAKETGYLVAADRRIETDIEWEIGILVQNMRGKVSGRPLMRQLLERIRDRLHHLKSTAAGGWRYQWAGEDPADLLDESLLGYTQRFKIHTYFGR